jgi:hypothetical protein
VVLSVLYSIYFREKVQFTCLSVIFLETFELGGNLAAADAMSMIAKFASRWFSDFGFSLGISDVTPSRM